MSTQYPKTLKDYIQAANKVHGNYYNYSRLEPFTKLSNKFKIECPAHGEFDQPGSDHLRGHGCRECGKLRAADQRRTKLSPYRPKTRRGPTDKCLEDMIDRLTKVHKGRYDYSLLTQQDWELKRTTKGKNKIAIICKTHGMFEQVYDYHRGGNGCQKCKAEVSRRTTLHRYEKNKKSTQEWINSAKAKHGNKYDYSLVNYTKWDQYITIICPTHGQFEQKACYHLDGSGCPVCGRGSTSPISTAWLKSLDIPHLITEYEIIDGNKKYVVDGFDPSTNTVYEFLGDYWHGNPNIYPAEQYMSRRNKTFGELYDNTMERLSRLEVLGYTVQYVWEFEYKRTLRL